MEKQQVIFKDLGAMEYEQAWALQERLLKENVEKKSAMRSLQLVPGENAPVGYNINDRNQSTAHTGPFQGSANTVNYLLFVEHPPRIYPG